MRAGRGARGGPRRPRGVRRRQGGKRAGAGGQPSAAAPAPAPPAPRAGSHPPRPRPGRRRRRRRRRRAAARGGRPARPARGRRSLAGAPRDRCRRVPLHVRELGVDCSGPCTPRGAAAAGRSTWARRCDSRAGGVSACEGVEHRGALGVEPLGRLEEAQRRRVLHELPAARAALIRGEATAAQLVPAPRGQCARGLLGRRLCATAREKCAEKEAGSRRSASRSAACRERPR